MTIDDVIKVLEEQFAGRTRCDGQEPQMDEMLVAEIKKLRKEVAKAATWDTLPLDVVVCKCYDDMKSEGHEPGADKWTCSHEVYRPQMIARVRNEWLRQNSECDLMDWPFNDDFVSLRWILFRKLSDKSKLRSLCVKP